MLENFEEGYISADSEPADAASTATLHIPKTPPVSKTNTPIRPSTPSKLLNQTRHRLIENGATSYSPKGWLLSKEQQTMHYLSPVSPKSPASNREGEPFIDYMKFFIQPLEKVSLAELSTISSSYLSCYEPDLQRTVAIVKPDAMVYKDVILRKIFESGFQIISQRTIHLTPEQVSEIYAKHYGSPSFPHLIMSISVAPVLVLSIAAKNIVNKWKQIIGPDGSLREDWFFPISMRKRFGLHQTVTHAIHGSENLKEANRENRYFYPDNILEPILTEANKVLDYCSLHVNPTLIDGLVEVVKTKPIDPVLFLADWLLCNNPYQPRLPYKISVTPT